MVTTSRLDNDKMEQTQAQLALDLIEMERVVARRNHLLDAATRVFAEKGFRGASLRDVAKAAGVTHPTIYHYFKDKTALLLGILDRLNETDRRAMDLATGAKMDLAEFFKLYLRQRLAVFDAADSRALRIILSEVLVNPELSALYRQRIIEPTFVIGEKHLKELMQRGGISQTDVPLLARMLAGMFLGLLTLRLMGDAELEAKWYALPDIMTSLILNGLRPTPRRRAVKKKARK